MSDRTYYYLIIANLLLISYYLIIIYLIDLSYVFSRFHGDCFNYFVMAKSLAETGSTDVSLGEGIASIIYTPIPAYVRFPLFLLFKDLETRLRAIQIFNIILLTTLANIYWIYLRKTIIVKWHKALTFLPFIYLCFNPWFSNVYLSLADIIYALFFWFIIIIIKTINFEKISWRRLFLVILVLSIFMWSAFLIKFTAISLIAFMIIYFLQNNHNCQESRRSKIAKTSLVIISILIIVIALLVNIKLINWYIGTGVDFYELSFHHAGHIFIKSMSNLLFSAVPSQIVPNYMSHFDYYGKISLGHELRQITLIKSLFLVIGLAISVIIGAGIWRLRRIMGAEIGCLLVMLPVLMIPTDSTARYLSVLQPIFWIFFLQGIYDIKRLLEEKSRRLPLVLLGIFIIIVMSTNYQYMRKISNCNRSGIGPLMIKDSVKEVSTIYQATRQFIDSLPKDRTRFVLSSHYATKWFAISGIKFIHTKDILKKMAEGYDIYVVIDCTQRFCKSEIAKAGLLLAQLAESHDIGNRLIFSRENDKAKSFIYKLYFHIPPNVSQLTF